MPPYSEADAAAAGTGPASKAEAFEATLQAPGREYPVCAEQRVHQRRDRGHHPGGTVPLRPPARHRHRQPVRRCQPHPDGSARRGAGPARARRPGIHAADGATEIFPLPQGLRGRHRRGHPSFRAEAAAKSIARPEARACVAAGFLTDAANWRACSTAGDLRLLLPTRGHHSVTARTETVPARAGAGRT